MTEKQNSPKQFFKEQVQNYSQQLSQIKKSIRQVAALRISSFLITVLGIYLTAGHSLTGLLIIAFAGFSLFGFFVFRHIRLYKQKKQVESLLQINENELRLMKRDTSHQPEGLEFLDTSHPFAADLDIFGKRSLFQLLDRSATHIGSNRLAYTLLHPLTQKDQIITRQEAIAELSEMPRWRQEFQALGNQEEKEKNSVEDLLRWAEKRDTVFNKPIFKILLVITPLLGLGVVGLSSFGLLPYSTFLAFLILPFLVLGLRIEKINKAYDLLSKKASLLEQYATLFEKATEKGFRSDIMQQIVKTLTEGEASAFGAVRKLSAISKAFDYRLNILIGIPLNIFFL
ncbi:MAG TPA: hypothetical protein ENG85_03360, partial [Bacteroidetes bacterium]|nr:hypothetical protein [Bacteroidota bacterium]